MKQVVLAWESSTSSNELNTFKRKDIDVVQNHIEKHSSSANSICDKTQTAEARVITGEFSDGALLQERSWPVSSSPRALSVIL